MEQGVYGVNMAWRGDGAHLREVAQEKSKHVVYLPCVLNVTVWGARVRKKRGKQMVEWRGEGKEKKEKCFCRGESLVYWNCGAPL